MSPLNRKSQRYDNTTDARPPHAQDPEVEADPPMLYESHHAQASSLRIESKDSTARASGTLGHQILESAYRNRDIMHELRAVAEWNGWHAWPGSGQPPRPFPHAETLNAEALFQFLMTSIPNNTQRTENDRIGQNSDGRETRLQLGGSSYHTAG
jgi:hypothetical protein